MNCHNCHQQVKGKFCSNCGEQTSVERFTIKSILRESVIEPFEKQGRGLPNTIRRLSFRPGSYIRRYIEGERNVLYPSGGFIVLIGAIVIFLSKIRYNFYSSEFSDPEDSFNNALLSFIGLGDSVQFLKEFFLFAEDYGTLLNITAIPVFALFSYLVFKSKKYTFGEHLILNSYITAQQLFFLILLIPFMELFPGNKYEILSVYSFLIIAYNFIVLIQFFEAPVLVEIFLSIVAIILSYIVQFFFNLGLYACFGNLFELLDETKVL